MKNLLLVVFLLLTSNAIFAKEDINIYKRCGLLSLELADKGLACNAETDAFENASSDVEKMKTLKEQHDCLIDLDFICHDVYYTNEDSTIGGIVYSNIALREALVCTSEVNEFNNAISDTEELEGLRKVQNCILDIGSYYTDKFNE